MLRYGAKIYSIQWTSFFLRKIKSGNSKEDPLLGEDKYNRIYIIWIIEAIKVMNLKYMKFIYFYFFKRKYMKFNVHNMWI